jgi:hypothetical protein
LIVDVVSRTVHRAAGRGDDGAYDETDPTGEAEWYPGVRVADLFPA